MLTTAEHFTVEVIGWLKLSALKPVFLSTVTFARTARALGGFEHTPSIHLTYRDSAQDDPALCRVTGDNERSHRVNWVKTKTK